VLPCACDMTGIRILRENSVPYFEEQRAKCLIATTVPHAHGMCETKTCALTFGVFSVGDNYYIFLATACL
jgi:hypothetical protein